MLGHVAQSVGGALPGGRPLPKARFKAFSAGTSTFTAPTDGKYVFYLQGAGGSGNNTGGGSSVARFGGGGALVVKSLELKAGDQVSVSLGFGGAGRGGTNSGNPGENSSVVFPGGLQMTATGGGAGPSNGTSAAGGVASGGDINVDGASNNTGNSALQAFSEDVPIPTEPRGAGFGGRASLSASSPSVSGDDARLVVTWME